MNTRFQQKLTIASLCLPIVMLCCLLIAPLQAAEPEGCWYEDSYYEHNTCNQNGCWFWQAGQRCKDGGWTGSCGCDPIIDG